MADRTHLETLVGAMTLSELAAKTGRSLSSIVDFAVGNGVSSRKAGAALTASPARAPANGRSNAAPKGRRAKSVNTRTAEGREAYDASVREAIEAARGPVGAAQIRGKAGGTPQQARAALHRLIEAGTITYTGQARATKYMPA